MFFKFLIVFCVVLILNINSVFSQISEHQVDYDSPKEYTIGGVTVSGTTTINPHLVISFSGLSQGQKITIPGDEISNAIKNLWNQRMFSDVSIFIERIIDKNVFLNIEVQSRPRLAGFSLDGVKKNEKKKLREKLNLSRGDVVTEQFLHNIYQTIEQYYFQKGFSSPDIEVIQKSDTLFGGNSVRLEIVIDKGERVRIEEITFSGNESLKDRKLRRAMKNTKKHQWFNVFRTSKYTPSGLESDKKSIVNLYHENGFRDAVILSDSVYKTEKNRLGVNISISEGNIYYFRNITWSGNTKYSSALLSDIIGIEKGEVYNPDLLNRRLYGSQSGMDITTLYMDDGHLFFNIIPVETGVYQDSIDIQIRIMEGPQAIINKVTFSGNTKTNDHVILREIRTKPGQKFSRSDIIRSQRELMQLGYFDPEKMDVIPTPNPEDGTVDIEYVLSEKPSDQIELSGGWGAGQVVGTVGIVLSNFSLNGMFDRSQWRPLPMGDGQRLTIRAQTNGIYYQSYNFSFTEPWFGGRRPNSLTFSAYHSISSNGRPKEHELREDIKISGVSVSLGRRLRFPDDYFILSHTLSYQNYTLNNYKSLFSFYDGVSNNLHLRHTISRSSIDAPIYPRRGTRVSLSLQWTPPYSTFDDIDDYSGLSDQEKFKWLEYHKWSFDATWHLNLVENLVLMAQTKAGVLGAYNNNIGIIPFERYFMGGDGISGFTLDGRDLVRLRGYENNSIEIAEIRPQGEIGATSYIRYTFEIRYPVSLNPNATVYVLGFAEAGNNWLKLTDVDPFSIYRSAGLGLRVFLPMFGLLGFDWGYGFDTLPGHQERSGGQFHISIGQQF